MVNSFPCWWAFKTFPNNINGILKFVIGNVEFSSKGVWVQILSPSFIIWVTLGEFSSLTQFPILVNWDKNRT